MADVRWQDVTCARCSETGQCTPWNDYYETPLWDGEGRVCERCFGELMRERPEFPAIGDVSEGRGELAGGDVQAVRFTKKVRRPSRHDQRTPLPGDADWKGRHG